MQSTEAQASRGLFLRRLGLTLGAAFGALAIPGGAKAITNNCCLDNTRCKNCTACTSGTYWHYCNCSPFNDSYCVCHSGTGCYSGGC
jgi:hypothetical protein